MIKLYIAFSYFLGKDSYTQFICPYVSHSQKLRCVGLKLFNEKWGFHKNGAYGLKLGVAIRVGGSGSCRVKIGVYDCMVQREPDLFINYVKVG